MSQNILIVDDDPHIIEVITFALKKAEMSSHSASNGLQALHQFKNTHFDLIVLDINMPEMDGLELCREIRKFSDVPILFLSSRDEEIDRILGLEIGGDDYVTKPFSPRELVARINVILKRIKTISPPPPTNEKVLQYGKLRMNIDQHKVNWDRHSVLLTATEFSILRQFLEHPKKVFSRETIMQNAYQFNVHVSDRTIDSHIRHIRQKLANVGCERMIQTLHGVGYKLSDTQ